VNNEPNNLDRIRDLYNILRDDDDLDKLQIELNQPNIFNVLGVQRQEIRHSNFLAWILDPNGNHGLGSAFIERILRHLSAASDCSIQESILFENQATAVLEVRREWKNIDILIVSEGAVICFENKVDSVDSRGQLSKYRQIVEKQFRNDKSFVLYIYLTPSGDAPNDNEETKHWVSLSYQVIVDHLQRVAELHKGRLSSRTVGYIQDYVSLLQRDIMTNHKVNELADVLYRNHKDLFDFVFENRTDVAESLYQVIEEKVTATGWRTKSKNKGFVRFITKDLEPLIPHQGKGWPGRESFLFEINFFWQKGKLVFKTVIPPTGNDVLKEVLCNAIAEVEGAKPPSGKQHLVHFTKSWPFNIDSMYSVGKEEVHEALEPMWPHIEKIVEKVEAALLQPQVSAILKQYVQSE